jgi:hypothetical protein
MRMRNLPLCLLGILSALVLQAIQPVQAQPYTQVYRIDVQPPERIFPTGFHTDGRSLSMFAHLFSNSCRADNIERRSGWVSTTWSREQALRFVGTHLEAGHQLANREGQNGIWLYYIQTDDSYFSALNILWQVIDNGHISRNGYMPHHAEILEALSLNYRIPAEREVLTRRILPRNIYSAAFFVFNPIRRQMEVVEESISSNAAFQPANTQMTNVISNLQTVFSGDEITQFAHQHRTRPEFCLLECDAAFPSRPARSLQNHYDWRPSCKAPPSVAAVFIGSED